MPDRLFEHRSNITRKFWAITEEPIAGNGYLVISRWGPIGSSGQSNEKHFNQSGVNLARRYIQKKINEKLNKGYVEITNGRQRSRAAVQQQQATPQRKAVTSTIGNLKRKRNVMRKRG